MLLPYMPKKEWSNSYRPCNRGMVLMGNDVACLVIAIYIVKIKMCDGVFRVYKGVRHVSNLKNNLVSLEVLDDFGYSFSSKGGVRKVTKGSLMVMKGHKVN